MKAKEAIKTLDDFQCDIDYAADFRDPLSFAIDEAKDALEKQVPKNVTHEATVQKCCTCPNCKNVVDKFEEFVPGVKTRILYKYCHFCGQKLNWGE